MTAVEIPAVVRNKAVGVGAQEWLDDLPDLVASLSSKWSLTVGRPYDDATEAFVAEATLDDGMPAVLKLLVPRDGDAARHEITVLRLVDGVGCVQLLHSDVERGVLLLERLGPSLSALGLPIGRRHEILCTVAERVWRAAPDSGLPTGAQQARWLAGNITRSWEDLDRPCSERAIAHAVACAERRIEAHDDERACLVHGDVHEWNTMQTGDDFKLVDPDGLLAEPEYDLGIIMREDPRQLVDGDPRARARWLADRTGLDAQAIWEWGVVERVSTGLECTKVELQPIGRQMLEVADAVAD
jgi:streptomycin 6-kinase